MRKLADAADSKKELDGAKGLLLVDGRGKPHGRRKHKEQLDLRWGRNVEITREISATERLWKRPKKEGNYV